MSSNNAVNRHSLLRGDELKLTLIAQGIDLVLQAGAQLVVSGESFGKDDLKKRVLSRLAIHQAVRELETKLRQARLDRTLSAPETTRFIIALRDAIKGYLGSDNPELDKFGFKPRKRPAPLSVEEKAAKNAKSAQTREKNHPHPSRDGPVAGGGGQH